MQWFFKKTWESNLIFVALNVSEKETFVKIVKFPLKSFPQLFCFGGKEERAGFSLINMLTLNRHSRSTDS